MDREQLVYKAKLAEQAERFDEMVADMKEVASQPQELTVEEVRMAQIPNKTEQRTRTASRSLTMVTNLLSLHLPPPPHTHTHTTHSATSSPSPTRTSSAPAALLGAS